MALPMADGTLEIVLERVLAQRRERPPPHARSEPVFGASPAMQKLDEQVARVAPAMSTVLLRGETGTGKGVVARALHDRSGRPGPFIELHCAALPEQLLESELFGYDKGAFTGATSRKPGRVELAEGGTLFLDEIGDISGATQVKLLRLLQDKAFERLGGVDTLRADVRVVAATHQKLETLIEQGRFREDLFYRLNVVTLWLPPLRARRADIAPLANSFCTRIANENGRPDVALSDAAVALLRKQRWPGNVRQLENFVERLVVLGDAPRIDAEHVRAELEDAAPFTTEAGTGSVLSSVHAGPQPLSRAVQQAEARAIREALAHTRGNRKLAARLLGISRATLYSKLAEYEIA
jgi:DNA-binding NtrC family response regulator